MGLFSAKNGATAAGQQSSLFFIRHFVMRSRPEAMQANRPDRSLPALLLTGLVLWGATPTLAATPVAPAAAVSAGPRANPLDASAPVPSAVYRSALAEHRAYRVGELGSWSDSNETVNRIGGWRTYAREGQAATAPAAPATNATTAAPAPQAGPAPAAGHRHR